MKYCIWNYQCSFKSNHTAIIWQISKSSSSSSSSTSGWWTISHPESIYHWPHLACNFSINITCLSLFIPFRMTCYVAMWLSKMGPSKPEVSIQSHGHAWLGWRKGVPPRLVMLQRRKAVEKVGKSCTESIVILHCITNSLTKPIQYWFSTMTYLHISYIYIYKSYKLCIDIYHISYIITNMYIYIYIQSGAPKR